jgi:hypothetical protein
MAGGCPMIRAAVPPTKSQATDRREEEMKEKKTAQTTKSTKVTKKIPLPFEFLVFFVV